MSAKKNIKSINLAAAGQAGSDDRNSSAVEGSIIVEISSDGWHCRYFNPRVRPEFFFISCSSVSAVLANADNVTNQKSLFETEYFAMQYA